MTGRTVGTGVSIVIGVAIGLAEGIRVSVSVSLGDEDGIGLVTGSGVALSSGLIVAFGEDFDVAVGVGLGFAPGVGDSSRVAGVLAWKGVEAASCARTNAAVASSAIAKTNRRMWVFLLKEIPLRDASPRASAGSRAIPPAAIEPASALFQLMTRSKSLDATGSPRYISTTS
jgi:hypothetical protein